MRKAADVAESAGEALTRMGYEDAWYTVSHNVENFYTVAVDGERFTFDFVTKHLKRKTNIQGGNTNV